MKKIVILIGVILLLSMVATANSITAQCTLYPAQFNFGAGSTTLNCPSFLSAYGGTPPTGTTEDSLTLYLAADYQFGNVTGNNDVKLTVTPGTGTGITGWAAASPYTDVTGTFSSSGTNPPIPVADAATILGGTNWTAAYTVGATSVVQTGGMETSSAGVYEVFGYSTGVPEPATMGLAGLALLGLGAMVRKGRKKA